MVQLLQRLGQWLAGTASAGLAGASFMLADASPGYSVESSMSALAAFPYVWACARAIADDAGTLPRVAVRRAPGGARKLKRELTDDPILRVLETPSQGWTGTQLQRQLWLDFTLCGNAYVWRPSEVELIRLHPADVTPLTAAAGLTYVVVGYRVNAPSGLVDVGRDEILHFRDLSWSSGPAALIGESVIRCLHQDLSLDLGAKKRAAAQSNKGRPDVIFSAEHAIGPELVKEMRESWEKTSKEGWGAFTIGRGLHAQVVDWSPREFEFAARATAIVEAVIVAFGVPPARIGLTSANYGTQKQQMRTYWEGIRARLRIFDDVWSTLAAPGVRIETDLSDVESLQVSYTERQQRVLSWAHLGATAADAAAYEGFDDAPVPDERIATGPSSGSGTSSRVEEPQGDKALRPSLADDLADYLVEAAPRFRALAEAEDEGVEGALARRLEVERLRAVLDRHTSPALARAWAERVVGDTAEAAGIGLRDGHEVESLRAFSRAKAEQLAARIKPAAPAREAA